MIAPKERAEHLGRVQRLVFSICGGFGLDRADRLNVASMVLDREVESFRSLDWDDWHRMADALTGAMFVAQITVDRRDRRQAAQLQIQTKQKAETK